MAHTPGPWGMEASAPEVGGWEIAPLDADGECDWDREVASVISNVEDARLLTAAPDLYAACRRALAVETSVTQGQERERREGYLDLLRAALAKAEGR
jgi:hypothetical protein